MTTTQTPPTAPSPPATRRRGVIIGVIVIGVLLALVLVGRRDAAADTTYDVTYDVGGTATSVSLTLADPSNGSTVQMAAVATPLSLGYVARRGAFVYVAAQNAGDEGDTTCSISVNGVVVRSSESFGAYTICTVSGRL